MPRKRKANSAGGGENTSGAPNGRSSNDIQQPINNAGDPESGLSGSEQQPSNLRSETDSIQGLQDLYNIIMQAQRSNNPHVVQQNLVDAQRIDSILQSYSHIPVNRNFAGNVFSHNNITHVTQSSSQLAQNTLLALVQMLTSQLNSSQQAHQVEARQVTQQESSSRANVSQNVDSASLLTVLQLLRMLQNQAQPTQQPNHLPGSFLAATHAQDQSRIRSLQQNFSAQHETTQEVVARPESEADNLSPHGPFTLYMSCDDSMLSEYQCLVRKLIELFAATEKDICTIGQGRNRRVQVGQVGVRCKHCSHIPQLARTKGAVYFPFKIDNLYQACQNMATVHLCDNCPNIPANTKSELQRLAKEPKSNAGGGKTYWSEGVRVAGVVEDAEGRLRFRDA